MGRSAPSAPQTQVVQAPSVGAGDPALAGALNNYLSLGGSEILNAFRGPFRGQGLRDLIPKNPFAVGMQYPQFDTGAFNQYQTALRDANPFAGQMGATQREFGNPLTALLGGFGSGGGQGSGSGSSSGSTGSAQRPPQYGGGSTGGGSGSVYSAAPAVQSTSAAQSVQSAPAVQQAQAVQTLGEAFATLQAAQGMGGAPPPGSNPGWTPLGNTNNPNSVAGMTGSPEQMAQWLNFFTGGNPGSPV